MRERALNWAGLLLLGGTFLWSALHVFGYQRARSQPDTIRLAHWQLEGGVREAFDAVAARYMERHPGVRIEQMAVPGAVYNTWLRTAFAGGVMPDLLALGTTPDENLASFFSPLSAEVARPNPHNVGTALEGVPWRETFYGGLATSSGLATMREYYSVPMAVLTVRIFYNKELWKEWLGDRAPPNTFSELLALCRDLKRIAAERGRPDFTPFAGSRFTANVLMTPLFQSQTQRLWQQINPLRDMSGAANLGRGLPFLPGLARLDSPEIVSGYSIMREVGQFFQLGFLQWDRDEAILLFSQGRAMMLPTGVWDYGSIRKQAPFPVGVFRLPFPLPEDPTYGWATLGPPSEAGIGLATNLHLSALSPNKELALDFLKFLTSVEGNALFSRISGWPPSVVGIPTRGDTEIFAPVQHGYPPGFEVAPLMHSSGELFHLQANWIHLLFEENGLDRFLSAMRRGFNAAVRSDVEKGIADHARGLRRNDLLLAGLRMQAAHAARVDELWQSQNHLETLLHRLRFHLKQGFPSCPAPKREQVSP